MVTTDEIAEVPLFSALAAADRERLSRTSADIRLAAGEYAVHEGERARALRRALRQDRGRQARRRHRAHARLAPAGRDLRRGADRARHAVPGGYRAAEPSRVMRVEAQRLLRDRRRGARSRRSRSARSRASASAACRASPPSRRKPRATSSATAGTRPAPSCAASSTATRSPSSGSRPTRRDAAAPGAATLPPETASCPALRLPDGRRSCRPHAARGRRAARPADPAAAAGVRRGHHRRRAGRPRGRGVRRLRGPAHARDRARGARRPGRDLVADRELPRLSQRRLGRRARPAARCSRRAGSARRSW